MQGFGKALPLEHRVYIRPAGGIQSHKRTGRDGCRPRTHPRFAAPLMDGRLRRIDPDIVRPDICPSRCLTERAISRPRGSNNLDRACNRAAHASGGDTDRLKGVPKGPPRYFRRAFALKRLLSGGQGGWRRDIRVVACLPYFANAVQFGKQGLQALAINHCG